MGILASVEFHVTTLIKNELSIGFQFHDLQHTRDVVAAIGEIASYENLNLMEWEDLMIAGWFHDTGFTISSEAHEQKSIFLASSFLREQTLFDDHRIERIANIIAATQAEYCPNCLTERIIKDADTYHLSRPNYHYYLHKLRKEWFENQGENISENDWLRLNLNFLNQHHYYTKYGAEKLDKRKKFNIRMLEFELIDSVLTAC